MKRSGPPKRKTPIRRGAPPKRGGRIRAISKKRRTLLATGRREAKAAVLARSGGRCEGFEMVASVDVEAASYCLGWGTDLHEKKKRSRNGSLTDPENILFLCRRCHEFTETEPAKATEAGLLVPSWAES